MAPRPSLRRGARRPLAGPAGRHARGLAASASWRRDHRPRPCRHVARLRGSTPQALALSSRSSAASKRWKREAAHRGEQQGRAVGRPGQPCREQALGCGDAGVEVGLRDRASRAAQRLHPRGRAHAGASFDPPVNRAKPALPAGSGRRPPPVAPKARWDRIPAPGSDQLAAEIPTFALTPSGTRPFSCVDLVDWIGQSRGPEREWGSEKSVGGRCALASPKVRARTLATPAPRRGGRHPGKWFGKDRLELQSAFTEPFSRLVTGAARRRFCADFRACLEGAPTERARETLSERRRLSGR